MRNTTFLILLFIFDTIFAETNSFLNLVAKSKIQVNAEAMGGHSGEVLRINIKNNTRLSIIDTINAGLIFICKDNNAQSLMVMDNYGFNLQPYANASFIVYSNCIIPSNYSPHKESKFTIDTVGNEKLGSLAKIIAKYRFYNSQTQSIVWALVKNEGIACTKNDSAAAWPIYQHLSKYINVHIYKPERHPSAVQIKPKFAFSTRVNITANITKQQNYSLICTDTAGKEIRSYYKNKSIKNGIYSVTIGLNELVEDSNFAVIFKFIDPQGHVLISKKVKNNHMEDKPRFWLYKTIFEYEVPRDLKNASLKLYDPTGNVFDVLYEHKVISSGARRAPYHFYHYYAEDTEFKLILFEDETEVLSIDLKPISHDEIKK